AASLLGDDTARLQGRVSANPLRHVDPFGTVVLPAMLLIAGGFLFGWAKPVPVNFNRLNPRRLGMVLVAAAGPGINFALAAFSALAMRGAVAVPEPFGAWLLANLENSVLINLILAVFNMIPLPPLDGGRVLVGLLPRPLARHVERIEPMGLLIILVALFLLPMLGRALGFNLNIFGWLIGGPVDWLLQLIAPLSGGAFS
ncbi:MAG: site-2 protease family protein, partial [Rhodospirillales bacterium]|nr:site-2 protease family protein [Rhodospirillales bacterium]